MSYLMKFELRNTFSNGGRVSVKWRSVQGILIVQISEFHIRVLYKRHTRLGQLLFWNNESERHFIKEAIKKEFIIKAPLPCEFVGV